LPGAEMTAWPHAAREQPIVETEAL
jgi:hypothetical protein